MQNEITPEDSQLLDKALKEWNHPKDFQIFAQGDQRWSSKQLGKGSRTIGQAGCLLTCLTMIARSNTDQKDITPDQANDKIKAQKHGFIGSGLNVPTASSILGIGADVDREPCDDHDDISRIKQMVEQERPVVIGIDYKDGQSSAIAATDHFVVVLAMSKDRRHFFIADPAGGILRAIPAKYETSYRGHAAHISEFIAF